MGSIEFEAREWVAESRNFSPDGIHDDERARRLGFDGGFVPGVVLYEHIAAELMRQGVPWLSEGRVSLRFRRPVYGGESVTWSVAPESSTFSIHGDDGMGVRASGEFTVGDNFPQVSNDEALAPPSPLQMGDPSLIGSVMRIEKSLDSGKFDEIAVISDFPRELDGRKLIPIGQWINPMDLIYAYFGHTTTVHFAGRIWHHSPLFEDESFSKTGIITGFSERRGNKIVEFNCLVAAADGRPVATIEHSSIYQLARERVSEKD